VIAAERGAAEPFRTDRPVSDDRRERRFTILPIRIPILRAVRR
jgi:hypothetical protein